MSNLSNQVCCHKCGETISVQKILEALRPNGFLRPFDVEYRKTGEHFVLWEPDINPAEFRIIEDSVCGNGRADGREAAS